MKKIKYNTNKFNFAEQLQNLFNIEKLDSINDLVPVFERKNDQNTKYHKLYYDWIRQDNSKLLYENFINEVVRPLYDESIVYQAIPTFRVCYPNNIAVGEFHKDKHYRNIEWAEKVNELNYFMPLTNAFDTNTIWVESEEDNGEIIQWDGSNLSHGNKLNKTGKCRISVDFRVIKKSEYIESNQSSINTSIKFAIGGYYKVTKK